MLVNDSSRRVVPRPGRAERYVDEMVDTVRGLLADGTSILDLKITVQALREMREAFRVFAKYRHAPKVSCFGSARTQPTEAAFRVAEAFARRIADAGFMVITGAGPGIMEACQRGAGRERSFGININLPFEQEANPIIRGDDKLLSFKYFFTRKLFFLKEAHAVVLFPGGFGTHDEGFETITLLQTGKNQPMPIILLDAPRGTYWKTWQRYVEDHILRRQMISRPDLSLYKVTDSIDEAVNEITGFYRVYHSSRYVREHLVLRLQRPLAQTFIAELADEFRDIIVRGTLIQRKAFPTERDDPSIAHLPRLAFRFDRTNFGRLRAMIDRINQAPEAEG
jgi:uncharacterized protein (TIGR00730 family)